MNKPVCWVIAGPNGAGKTTFALKHLPAVNCQNFVNADLIASGLSPLEPGRELVSASRLFLNEMNDYIAKRESFGFETTLSGRGHLRRVKQLVDLSLQRVKERVVHGGHSVPEGIIIRRYPRSLHNLFECYTYAVSSTHCYMNSGVEPVPVFVQGCMERQSFGDY